MLSNPVSLAITQNAAPDMTAAPVVAESTIAPIAAAERANAAEAFYQRLETDAAFHRAYVTQCSCGGRGDDRQPDTSAPRPWPESQVINFAADQGYVFGLGELYRVWFDHEDYLAQTLFVDSLQDAGITLIQLAATPEVVQADAVEAIAA
jgi:hypothetical protein